MNLFGKRSSPEVRNSDGAHPPALAADDFAGRAAAMNERAAKVSSASEAVSIVQEAAAITNDLLKAVAAMTAKPEENKQSESANDGGNDDANSGIDDDASSKPALDAASNDAANEAPNDSALEANAIQDEAMQGDDENEEPFAKSVEELLAEANRVAQANGAELQVDASQLVGTLLKAVGASQEQSQTTNDYLEQLGTLLAKSLEGLTAITENQRALHQTQQDLDARLERIENEQRQILLNSGQEPEGLTKSLQALLAPVVGYIESQRQAPKGTPTGRAPLAANSIADVALADAAPMIEPEAESHNGFTRGELKKGIEAHIRSDRAKETGITPQHFLAIGKTPLADLDPLIYQVAAKELGRHVANS